MPAVGEPEDPFRAQLRHLRPVLLAETRPFLRLGGLTGTHAEEFDSRNPWLSSIELSNGTIVVMDLARLLYFKPDGSLLRVAGRHGRGPGEFLQAQSICALRGDTIIATDLVDGRISLWDKDGHHIRTFARPGPPVRYGCHPRGYVIVGEPAGHGKLSDTADTFINYKLVRPSGDLVTPLGRHPAPIPGADSPVPFLLHTGERLIVGNGRRYEIRVYDARARLRQVTRLLRDREPITDAQWKERIARAIPRRASESDAKLIRGRLSLQKPVRYPAFTEMRLDPHGMLWVSDFASDQGWTVFDSSGLIAGRFDVAALAGSQGGLAGFGRDFITIRSRDDDGALRLDFHRIRPVP
jgi:hypothetical protein